MLSSINSASQFTDINNPDIYATTTVFVTYSRSEITLPSDVGAGDPFTVTYRLYADAGNTPLDGSLYREGTYLWLEPYISSEKQFIADPYYVRVGSSGVATMTVTIKNPGVYDFTDYDIDSSKIRVHPKSPSGALLPIPAYTINVVDNQILIDTEMPYGMRVLFYNGTDGSSATLPGSVNVTSNDPQFVPETFVDESFYRANGPFSIYTGNGAPLTLTFTPEQNASWAATYNYYTYPYLSLGAVPLHVQQSESITVTVFATYPNGTLLTEATDLVMLELDTTFAAFVVPDFGGELEVCKPMVNGQVSFTVHICSEDFIQVKPNWCEYYEGYNYLQSSPVIVVGNPPLISQLGIAPLPPQPTKTCPPRASPAPSSTPDPTGLTSAKPKSHSSVKWYIPVAAVLGGLVLVAVIGVLVYVFVIKSKASGEYIVRA